MKKIIITILIAAITFSMLGCGSNNNQESSAQEIINTDTLGGKYLEKFANSSTENVSEAVDELISINAIETELVKMDVNPGYLDGFTEEISGFNMGVKFSPMIGSIPFVGYVFETENPEELLAKLTEVSDPRWNICTEADETVSFVRGNLVFFLMCSNETE